MREKLIKARTLAAFKWPYFSTVLFAFQPVEMKSVPTIAVDQGLRLYYNPEKIEEWSIEEVAGALLHEVGHVLREHGERRGDRDHIGWNMAADAEINDDLCACGVKLPEGAIYPGTLLEPIGQTAEFYYSRLTSREGAQDCGSVVGGEPREYELPPDDPRAKSLSRGAIESIRKEVFADLEERLARGEYIPEAVVKLARERARKTLAWKQLLMRYIEHITGTGYWTYSLPSRRQGMITEEGVLLPRIRKPTCRVAVVLDTSGSMSERQISQAVAELDSICRLLELPVDWMACNVRVYATGKGPRVRISRGGGTDMRNGIAAAENLVPVPAVIVVLTDCETQWPSKPGRIPIIVGVIGGSATSRERVPHWMRVVYIE